MSALNNTALRRWIPIAGLLACTVSALPASAQQIRPRVILMVDTSSSMANHFNDQTSTGGDGSTLYTDAILTRGLTQTPGFGLYPGKLLSGNCTNPPTTLSSYDGVNSRMYGAKAAVTNIVNATGSIDFGLMRYTGPTCPVVNTFTSVGTMCTKDSDCAANQFCVGGVCGRDNNLCWSVAEWSFACPGNRTTIPTTFAGDCGTSQAAGSALCATPQVCYADADCTGAVVGQCQVVPGGSASTCTCNGNAQCPTGYICTAGRCAYNKSCRNPGGQIVVDPSTAGSNLQILPYVDGIEALPGNLLGIATNPELRQYDGTPLAGSARAATTWYNNIKTNNLDAQIACRPYVLVQITDGEDSCDNDQTLGPVTAAGGFVAATVPSARVLNKVYVVGVSFGGVVSPTLNAIAKVGGTGSARFANSQADIQAALADIVQSSVLVEKCNNADDNCNAVCDESFPDVALSNANGCTPRAAKTCDNGALPGTHCYAAGVYVCSNDQLSEVCSAKTCAQDATLCPTAEAMGACNNVDDDCNGVVDDCTPFVNGSCCLNKCPACNLAGVPQPETCNGCDDDCDGTVDNHLTDTGRSCGSGVGLCEPGTTYCCQEGNPAVGMCTQSQVTPAANNPDKLVCLGGRAAGTETCNGVDDNCNGVIDEISQSCYPFGQGTPGVGICRAGLQDFPRSSTAASACSRRRMKDGTIRRGSAPRTATSWKAASSGRRM